MTWTPWSPPRNSVTSTFTSHQVKTFNQHSSTNMKAIDGEKRTNEDIQERSLRADTAWSNASQHLCHLAPEFASKQERTGQLEMHARRSNSSASLPSWPSVLRLLLHLLLHLLLQLLQPLFLSLQILLQFVQVSIIFQTHVSSSFEWQIDTRHVQLPIQWI